MTRWSRDRGERGPKGDHGQTGDKGGGGPKGAKGDQGKDAPIHPWRWRALSIWILLFSLVTVASLNLARQAAKANRDRITDIQASRVSSCKQNYEGIREVFKPFQPQFVKRPPRKGETAAMKKARHDWSRFNNIIDTKKAACAKQTRPKG